MSDTTQTNAMAEIALALAMGFFSIMVLTMVSMGSGMVTQAAVSAVDEEPITIAKTQDKPDTDHKGSNSAAVKPENLVIFYGDQYLDHNLKALDIKILGGRNKVVLAVSPDLSMSKTMEVRKNISNSDITVVVLNDKWLAALKEAKL